MATAETKHAIVYAFGNHMHWADMEWLWGSHVLADSVHDMLRVCAATGAHAHINFDAIGYEKLASEDPAALADLRRAIQAGNVEVAGGSYGQPYGLFHGAESNARQLHFRRAHDCSPLGGAPAAILGGGVLLLSAAAAAAMLGRL